MIKEIAEE
jgi:hypothetical protein